MAQKNIQNVYIGIDLGNTGKTVFTMVGVPPSSDIVYIIDAHEVVSKYEDSQDYTDIVNDFDEFISEHWDNFGHLIRQVRVDKASPHFRNHLRNNSRFKLSVQSTKSDKITDRVTLKQQLLFQGRFVFSNTFGCGKLVSNLKRVRGDGKGGHIDDNTPEIDYSDSLDYAIEPISFRLITKKIG